MGLDCPKVRLIFHYGVPSDVEIYIQEVGRARRDGQECYAVALYSKKLSECSNTMVAYAQCTNCRRDTVFEF